MEALELLWIFEQGALGQALELSRLDYLEQILCL